MITLNHLSGMQEEIMGRHATFVAAFVTGFLAGSGLFGTELQAQDRNVLLDAYGEVRDASFDYMRTSMGITSRS